MKPSFSPRVTAGAFLIALVVVPVSSAAHQSEREIGPDTRKVKLRQVLTGRVYERDGSPAPGAVVMTSAGGQSTSGVDGTFELALEVPLAADCVEVTAVASTRAGRAVELASARVALPSLSSTIAVGALVLTPAASARWRPTFGGHPGMDHDVEALAVFDDGTGAALYAGGRFVTAGGVGANHIARWDGSDWSALGDGLGVSGEFVLALAVFDDGNGPALHAGGDFESAGGLVVNSVARWDGSGWSALGSGIGPAGKVGALATFDDGSGPALYVGGSFTSAGGVPANGIARWDGSSWSALGSGVSGGLEGIEALVTFDDGSGAALYAGGDFTSAGGAAANHVARWDGTSWSPLGSGLSPVHAFAVCDEVGGSQLYAGGEFYPGGAGVQGIARWDGTDWVALGAGVNNDVHALASFDDGDGPALYVGGSFLSAGGGAAMRIAKWDGSSWSTLAQGIGVFSVLAIAGFDDGDGPRLHVAGDFQSAGVVPASKIARWSGSQWGTLGSGLNGSVSALTTFDAGSGPALIAGGSHSSAGGTTAVRVARWTGSAWQPMGIGLGLLGTVRTLAVFDDGGGPDLYAGGAGIRKWTGASWGDVGSSPAGIGEWHAMAVFDDGGGKALYAGGFSTTTSPIARWNGSSWSGLGTGITDGFSRSVNALAVFDDGSGPALYVGGRFMAAGEVDTLRIARWDGTTWSGVGGGMNNLVNALTVFDDGGGPALYAGGTFTVAGGVAANHVARWDGASWSALGSGTDGAIDALAVFDDGRGPALFAGGNFDVAGGVAASSIARWDGSSWSALSGTLGIPREVNALAVFDGGRGPTLVLGGAFRSSPAGDSYAASWCRGKTRRKQH